MFWKKKNKYGEALFKCPRCKVYMEKIRKENVVIDVCRKCSGMWLDDREIDKLLKLKLKIRQEQKKLVKKPAKKA